MHIRRLTLADAPAFRDLRLEALQTTPAAFGNSYENEVAYPLARFEDRIRPTEDCFTMGAFTASYQLIASCSFARMSGPFVQHKGNVMGLYCQPAYHGQGVATQLVTSLLEEARQLEGLLLCQLSVVTTNHAAIKLYEKLGFRNFGHEKQALFDGQHFRDEYFYSLNLFEGSAKHASS